MTARPPALGKLDLEQGVLAVDYVQVSSSIWCSAGILCSWAADTWVQLQRNCLRSAATTHSRPSSSCCARMSYIVILLLVVPASSTMPSHRTLAPVKITRRLFLSGRAGLPPCAYDSTSQRRYLFPSFS
jgi:hypothetical protein